MFLFFADRDFGRCRAESPVTPYGENEIVEVSGRRATPHLVYKVVEKEGSFFGLKSVQPYRICRVLVSGKFRKTILYRRNARSSSFQL